MLRARFLYGDLHAHMIALVLAVTALGLMVALARLTHEQRRRWLPSLGIVGFLALTVGALRATNTWDYPTYLGLSIVTLGLVAWQHLRLGHGWRNVLLVWVLNSVLLAVLASLLFQPFTSHFATDYAGFVLWQGARTPIRDYLMLHGLWLFLLASGALALYHRRYGLRAWHWMLIGAAVAFLIAAVLENVLALYIVAPLAIIAAGFGTELLITSPAPSEKDESPSPLLVSLATQLPVLWGIAALWLTLVVELIAARGDIGRMNTFFKLGMQSWVLFAISSAIVVPWVWRSVVPYASRRIAVRGAGLAWRVAASLLIVAALAYPVTATPARLGDRYDRAVGMTLDGAAYMRSPNAKWAENGLTFSLDEDADAIEWLRANVRGTPIILEAHTEAYRWGGRISIYTGLPTLLGWHGHERQQRAVAGVDSALENRRIIVNQLYTSTVPTETLRLLKRYGVEYVYVGQLERALYGGSGGLETLDRMADTGQLQRVYQRGSTTIYQLLPGAKPPALLTTAAKLQTPSLPATKSNQLVLPVDQLPALGDYAWNRLADSQPIAVLLWLLFSYLLLLLGLPLAALVFGRRLPASAESHDDELDIEAVEDVAGEDGATSVLNAASEASSAVAQVQSEANLDAHAASDVAGEDEAANALNAASEASSAVARARPVASRDAQQRLSAKPVETPMLSAIGYAWARLIGLLLLGYAVWLPVSARLWSYNRLSILIGVLLVLLLNVGLLAWLGRAHRASPDADDSFDFGASLRNGYGVLLANLMAQRQHILLIEGVFLIAFALMTLLRMFNPDLWQPILGGEKPFEFGFLNAILRSPVMPPYDPFYSGNTINYYYYGLFLASLPIKATGIAPAVGFNLAIATFYALTFIGGFAVVQRLTNTVRYGLAGAVILAVLGNLAANFQVGSSRGLKPIIDAINDGGFADLGARIGDWFWGPSRVITGENLTTINEFPFWTFLFADLHPHLIALPITVLVIGLIYELFDRRATAEHPLAGWRLFGLQALLTSFVLGSLAVTNSWDVPTYALLLVGALIGLAWRSRTRPGFPWLGSIGALLLSGLMVGGGLVFYLSFFQNFQAPVGGIGRVTTPSPIHQYVLHYGIFLAMLIPLVYVGLWRLLGTQRRGAENISLGMERQRDASALGIAAQSSGGQSIWQRLQLVLIVVPILLGFILSRPTISLQVWLATLLVMTVCLLLSRRISPTVWFTLLMVAMAWAVSLGIEIFYIRDHLDGGGAARMNTVFKFGNQIWTLMALSTAASLPLLSRWMSRQHWLIQSVVGIVVSGLFVLGLTFPIFGTMSRSALRFPIKPGLTLDGLAFMETAEFDVSARDMGLPEADFPIHLSLRGDLEAIRWLNETIKGTPVVLQSDLWFYRTYGTRVAANTGLPTIISPLHASEQHDPRLVAERDMHVQAIYRSPDINQTLQLLARYRVGYIYVGQIERAAYGELGIQKFDSMVGSYLSVVYDRDGVRIYRVHEGVYTLATPTADAISLPSLPAQVVTQPSVPNTPAQSLEALEEQVRQNPTVASLAFGLGQMYYMEGRLDDAIRVLERAAVANPSDVALQQVYGDVLRDAGRNDEAAAAYRTAAQAAPSAGNYNKLGMHLLDTGMLDEATDAFLQAIASDANVPEPYFYLGQIYERQAQADQALDYYQLYLDIAPPDGHLRPEAEAALARLQ
jgi:YYY domain-containing protein